MARNITVNTEVTGEASFKQAMSQISDSLRVVKSEMNAASAEFVGQQNSMEALTAKHDSLTEKLELEAAKVEALKQAMEDTAKSTGENSSETKELAAQYNNARAAMLRTQNELNQVNSYMEEAAASADGCATSINGYGKAVGDAKTAQDNLATGAPNSFDTVATAITDSHIASKLGEIANKLNEITLSAAAYADNVITLSSTMGIATSTVQELQYSSELVDVSVDTIAGSMRKTTSAMNSARDGTGAAALAFENLGVKVTNQEGNLRNSETVFWEVIDALGAIENPTERDALAMELFGRSAQTLNPLISAGSEGMAAFRAEAEKMGYILSDSELATLGGLDDASQRFANATESLQNSVGLAWAPILTEITDAGTAAFTALSNIIRDHPALTSSLGATITSLAGISGGLLSIKAAVAALKTAGILSGATAATIGTGLAAIAGPLSAIVAVVAAGIPLVISYGQAWENQGFLEAGASLEDMKANVESCNKALEDFQNEWGTPPTTWEEQALSMWGDDQRMTWEALNLSLENATAQYEEALAASEGVAESIDATATYQERLTEAVDTTTDAVNGLIDAYNSAYNSAASSISGTLGMFNELDTNLGKSTKEVVQNWDAQAEAVESYTENLQSLRTAGLDETLVLEISSGSLDDMKLAQQLMADIDAGNISADTINDQWEARQQAIAEYAAYVAEQAPEVETAMQALVDAASAGAGDMDISAEMATSAANTIAGYVDALDAGPIKDKMTAIAEEALAAFNTALGIASPSRRMMESGRFTVQGFTAGVNDSAQDVAQTMTALADTAVSSFDTQLGGIGAGNISSGAAGGITNNFYVQDMTEAQTDYLISELNRRLGI